MSDEKFCPSSGCFTG